MLARVRLAAIVFVPIIGTVFVLREERNVSASLQLFGGALPMIFIICLAATVPHGLPPASARYAAGIYVVLTVLFFPKVIAICRSVDPTLDEAVRATVDCTWMVGNAWLAWYIWHQRQVTASFWIGLRINLCVGNCVRLAAVLLLRVLMHGPDETVFPPGHLDFASAIHFNLGCLALAAVGLSPPCRHRLSNWTRAGQLDLAAIPGGLQSAAEEDADDDEPTDAPGSVPLGLNQADRLRPPTSVLSFNTYSDVSTLKSDDPHDFGSGRPLNALHAVDTQQLHKRFRQNLSSYS